MAVEATQAMSIVGVTDIEATRAFYGRTLGLHVEDDDRGSGGLIIQLGGGQVLAYPKPDVEVGNDTRFGFEVADIGQVVDDLIAKGVTFEQFEGFDQDDRGITPGSEELPPSAWCLDPSGHILMFLETEG